MVSRGATILPSVGDEEKTSSINDLNLFLDWSISSCLLYLSVVYRRRFVGFVAQDWYWDRGF